ncbi:hypothetical protein D3C87_2075010 [compost metagenome]
MPRATTSVITRNPACVPATMASPALVPRDRELATITVTVGPGTMASKRQAPR